MLFFRPLNFWWNLLHAMLVKTSESKMGHILESYTTSLGHILDITNKVVSDPWKPWKNPKMVDTPEKVPEIPWKLGWSLKKHEKKPAKIGVLSEMIVAVAISSILVPKFSHASGNYYHCLLLRRIFLFIQVNSHCPRASRALENKGTWKTINWHRNCPVGCQYQLLNCWYTSIRQWICVFTEWLSIGNVHTDGVCR